MQMTLPQLKYFLKELMIIDVEMSLQTQSVVVKLQLRASTVPGTVFSSIFLMISLKKKSHSFSIFNDYSTELAYQQIVSYFCPSCLTNSVRSFSAFLSIYLDRNREIMSQISSGTRNTSPWLLQGSKKALKKLWCQSLLGTLISSAAVSLQHSSFSSNDRLIFFFNPNLSSRVGLSSCWTRWGRSNGMVVDWAFLPSSCNLTTLYGNFLYQACILKWLPKYYIFYIYSSIFVGLSVKFRQDMKIKDKKYCFLAER